MKIFGVVGVSTSGKTTLVVNLVKELVSRGFSVGTVKSIGCGRTCLSGHSGKSHKGCSHAEEGFTIDTKGKNSYKHRKAGASQTATWSENETALIFPRKFSFDELISNYDYDFLVVEGFKSSTYPKIVTGITEKDVERIANEYAFAVSGKVADNLSNVGELKTFKTFEDIKELADLAIEKAVVVGEYKKATLLLNNSSVEMESVEKELRNLLLKLNIDQDSQIKISIETN